MNYTVQYFIDKFEAIPEGMWLQCDLGKLNDNKHCALGFCGGYAENSSESEGLAKVLMGFYKKNGFILPRSFDGGIDFDSIVYDINDGNSRFTSFGDIPRARILAALYDIRAIQQPAYSNISKSLAVLPVSETSDVINQPVNETI